MCMALMQYVGLLLLTKLYHIIKCKKLIILIFLFV